MDSSTQNLHINVSLESELNNVANFVAEPNTCPAVEIRDAWLTFGGKDDAPGVRGATMTVNRGSIYALLGPSGCGKTTLVSTVVGSRTPLKGDVRVLGERPGSRQSGAPGPWIGFMPQETCLLPELTVEETISFFATINCVPKSTQKNRVANMIKILELPEDRFVRQLSGGQQRRLSLAVALVHDPPLVVLDEPTVGVDPLLRNTIWRHLTRIVKEKGQTVILTTHYVEEARAANKVALMRFGKILIEESPTLLMRRFSASTLEEVFLKLCTNQAKTQPRYNQLETSKEEENGGELYKHQNISSTDDHNTVNCVQSTSRCNSLVQPNDELGENEDLMDKSSLSNETNFSPLPNVRRTFRENMAVILGVCWKDQCLLRRNYMYMLLAFVVPIMNFFMIRLYFGHLPVGLTVILVGGKTETLAKSLLSDHFGRAGLDVTLSDSLEGAIQSVRYGNTNAVIQIPDEYSINIFRRFRLGTKADNATVEKSRLRLFMDNSNMVIGSTVYVSILKSMQSLLIEMGQNFGASARSLTLPLHFCDPVYGKPDIELTHAIMLGEILQSLFVIGLFISVLTFVKNRENRMLHRLKACGLGPFEMMASHMILHSGLLIVQTLTMLGVLIGLQIQIQGSYIILFILMALAGYLGMACGMVISVMAGQIYVAVLLASLLQFATIAMAGIFWPFEGTDSSFRRFSYIHPMLFLVRALKLVTDHGVGLESFNVWFSIPFTLLYITLFVLLSAFIYNGSKLEIVESILAFRRPNIILPWKKLKLPAITKTSSKS